MRQRLLCLLVTAFLSSPALAAPGDGAQTLTPTSLPRTATPTAYRVSLAPHVAGLSFDGHVSIDIDVKEPTDTLVLNASNLTFARASIRPRPGTALVRLRPGRPDDLAQTVALSAPARLDPGPYTLDIDYQGKIARVASGLFSVAYDTPGGEAHALYTQFENAEARKVFPSWDEPAYKATFTLDVLVPAADATVSNMPVDHTDAIGTSLKRVWFSPTPKMSTYLLFLAVGDFEREHLKTGNTELGVWTRRGALGEARFALDSSEAILSEYNRYFGVAFPLPKLDNVAGPGRSQFFGAMENWGAIFTFEKLILMDPAISSEEDRHRIFDVEAHEMAHQWFGDLVTMRWWNELWLNEGFASWMASRTTVRLHPEWHTSLSSVAGRENAMANDAVATSHAIVQRIDTADQASQAFDVITYFKGEAVISMLEDFVGEDAWQAALQHYMAAHQYGNAVSDDLWAEVDRAAGKPVSAIAHDFTDQPGVPLVRVSNVRCSAGKTTVHLTQDEFTKDRPGKATAFWHVPVTASVAGQPTARLILNHAGDLTLVGCGPVIVNAGQKGYYRTLYAPDNLAALAAGLGKLSPIDQLGLMADTWNLGLAGRETSSAWLDLVAHLPEDAAPEVWVQVAGNLDALNGYLATDPAANTRLRRFASTILGPQLRRLGWVPAQDESPALAVARGAIVKALGNLDDATVLAEARRRFADEGNPSSMPPGLKSVILGIIAAHADQATWEALHARAQAEKNPMVRDELYGLLALASDDRLSNRALLLATTNEPGPSNSATMISLAARAHPGEAFDFAVAHKAEVDRFVDAQSASRFYPGLAASAFDTALVTRLDTFAATYIPVTSRHTLEQAEAGIRYRASVRATRLAEIARWLARHA